MKILHITDSHGTVKSPENRKDIYYLAFLKKLYELGFVIKKEKINMVVHTGDMFHTARVSDKFTGQVAEMIKAWDVPVYVVPGNHDIEGYTIDTIDQTKLGLLAKAGVVNLLTRDNPVTFDVHEKGDSFTVSLSGQEYYANIDSGDMNDFEMRSTVSDFNILAIHGYITDTPQHPDIRCTLAKDIITDADVILSGHYHRQFEASFGDFSVYNPGSMMRIEQNEYNKTHIPQYGILDVFVNDNDDIEYNYKFHNFRIAEPSSVIFDYDAKYKSKLSSITLDGFKNSLSNTMSQLTTPTSDMRTVITNLFSATPNLKPAVLTESLSRYDEALRNCPVEFTLNGYIPSNYTKTLKRIIINNFQSHEHTVMDFEDGLNIIVGESNSGKTSIMRAIMWAIDNQPLGSDFIMAGKNDCSVQLIYSDGTSITRKRTKSSTGEYIIETNESGKITNHQYAGFTNAVPVDIDNVHQMPKVSLTKDIETHLNVLSQLDEPFLLNESPINKAAAIGRITGTHIVDASIKECSKEIVSNTKAIKVHQKIVDDNLNELNAKQDISILKDIYENTELIYHHLLILQKKYDYLNTRFCNINTINNNINIQQSNLAKAKTVHYLKPIINHSLGILNNINYLNIKLDRYNSTINAIQNMSDSFKNNNWMSRVLWPLVLNWVSNITTTKTLYSYLSNYQSIKNNIDINFNNLNIDKKLSSVGYNIINHCTDLINNLQQEMRLINKIDALNTQIEDTESSVLSLNNIADNIYEQQETIKHERMQYLIDSSAVCPCCGQQLSNDEQRNHLIEFFKECKS